MTPLISLSPVRSKFKTFCSRFTRPPLLFFRYWGMRIFHLPATALAATLLLSLWSPAALAQENSWSVGLKGGSTFSFVSGTQETITNDRTSIGTVLGYTGGLAVQYLTEKNFGLQVEFNYTQKGWRQRAPESAPNRRYQVYLDYAEVPILAHGYFGKKNLRIFLNAGVYLAYLLSSETDRANVVDDDVDFLYLEQFQNQIDFGVRGGGGLEVVTKVGMFQAEGGYNWGINSILDKGIDQIPNIIQNNTIAITLGYYVQF